jgi:hypothetical protein
LTSTNFWPNRKTDGAEALQIQGLVVAIFVHATPEWYCFPQDLSASVKTFPANLAHRQQPPRGRLRADLRAVLALGMLVLGALQLRSQAQLESGVKPGTNAAASSSATKVAGVKSFRIVQEKEGQAVEILSTKPLIPSIKAMSDPVRLVIDLPNARLETEQKRISVEADQISDVTRQPVSGESAGGASGGGSGGAADLHLGRCRETGWWCISGRIRASREVHLRRLRLRA